MISAQYTERLPRPREEVFDFMTDSRNAPRWMALVNRLEVPGDGSLQHGGSFMIVLEMGDRETKVLSHVTVVERPRSLGWWNVVQGLRTDFLWRLEPDGTGTQATLSARVRPVTLGGWILLPFVMRDVPLRIRERVERLRVALSAA